MSDSNASAPGRRWLPSRRSLLAGAVGLVASVAGLAALQPRRGQLTPFAPDTATRPRTLPSPKRVVVIGGGLAGIAAATTLAERGFHVTVLERAPQLGGKVAGWQVDVLGRKFSIEHGFHGFFKQYANLDRLLAPTGTLPNLRPLDEYPIWFGDRDAERFGGGPRWFPLNLLSVVIKSAAIKLTDFVGYDEGLLELLRYDPQRTFAELDAMDFATFCRERVKNSAMVETVLLPFAETTLNRPERLSAAEAIRFFHAYFIGNPDGLGFRVATKDSAQVVVDPLVARLKSLGVTVRTGASVERILGRGPRVSGVVVRGGAGGGASGADVLVPVSDVPVDGRWLAAARADGTPVFVRRDGEAFRALDGRCTHKGCPVAIEADAFRCPCHDGRFDAMGQVVSGPPPRALAALVAVQRGDEVVVSASEPEETLDADHVILAVDSRAAKAVLDASTLALPDLDAWRGHVGQADPYVVWRMWVDRPVHADVAPFYTVSKAGDLDALAVYSAFQEEAQVWAAETGGAVIEAHAYAVPPDRVAAADVMKQRLWAEVVRVLPELEGAQIQADVFMMQDDFTRFAPGDAASRPRTRTSMPNLQLAGDWVRMDAPVFLMEGAVTSGLLAANAVLASEGLAEEEISTVDAHGPIPA